MAIFLLVYTDEDLIYTFPYNALIMCLCHEISVEQPHNDTATHQTNKSTYNEKKAGNKT